MRNAIITLIILIVLYLALNKMFGKPTVKKKNKYTMNIKIVRKIFTDKSTIGEMYIDGKFFCYTLEDKVRDSKIAHVTAIPYGAYDTIIDYSQRFKENMPHLLNVQNFDGIRIHNGNTDADTEGCILLGTTKGKDFVGNSKVAFNNFMKLISIFKSKMPTGEIVTEITK